jgi:hypothetical protein
VKVLPALFDAAGDVNDNAIPALFDAAGDGNASHVTPPGGASSSSESSTGLSARGDGVADLADSLRALSVI